MERLDESNNKAKGTPDRWIAGILAGITLALSRKFRNETFDPELPLVIRDYTYGGLKL